MNDNFGGRSSQQLAKNLQLKCDPLVSFMAYFSNSHMQNMHRLTEKEMARVLPYPDASTRVYLGERENFLNLEGW